MQNLTIQNITISHDLAIQLVHAAIEHAKTLNLAICVAVVDPTGHLISFAKMDDACLIAIGTAQGKAYTAARSGLTTRDFLNYLSENEVCINSLQDEKLVLIPGGSPIYYQEKVIGGIGIGGGTGKQDDECVQIALKKIISSQHNSF